jgi:hypothetical protein
MRKDMRKHSLTAAVALLAACYGSLASADATTLTKSADILEADPAIEKVGYYSGYGHRHYGSRGNGYYGHSYYRPYRYYRPSYYRGYYDEDCY